MDSTNGSASPCTETTIEFKKERSETGICRIGTLLLYLCTKIIFFHFRPARHIYAPETVKSRRSISQLLFRIRLYPVKIKAAARKGSVRFPP